MEVQEGGGGATKKIGNLGGGGAPKILAISVKLDPAPK